MIETRTKDINGATYSVTQLPARRALKLQCKLMRIFGPPLAQLFLSTDSKASDQVVINDTDGSAIALPFTKDEAVKSLALIMAQLDDKTFESLVLELLQGVRKSGVELTEPVIDLEFAGDLATLIKVLWFVLEVNYDNFFGDRGFGSLFSWQAPARKEINIPLTSIRN